MDFLITECQCSHPMEYVDTVRCRVADVWVTDRDVLYVKLLADDINSSSVTLIHSAGSVVSEAHGVVAERFSIKVLVPDACLFTVIYASLPYRLMLFHFSVELYVTGIVVVPNTGALNLQTALFRELESGCTISCSTYNVELLVSMAMPLILHENGSVVPWFILIVIGNFIRKVPLVT